MENPPISPRTSSQSLTTLSAFSMFQKHANPIPQLQSLEGLMVMHAYQSGPRVWSSSWVAEKEVSGEEGCLCFWLGASGFIGFFFVGVEVSAGAGSWRSWSHFCCLIHYPCRCWCYCHRLSFSSPRCSHSSICPYSTLS